MDITPRVHTSRITLDGYGNGGFRARGTWIEGSALVFPDRIEPWQRLAPGGGALTLDAFAPLLAVADNLDVVLVGCGTRMQFLRHELRRAFEDAGVGIDPMDTGAACRTFNVLAIEGRDVAAALIAVD